MILKLLLFSLIFLLACGKQTSGKKDTLGVALTTSISDLKAEHRSLTKPEITLLQNACKVLMAKRAYFASNFHGKNFYFNLDVKNCTGKTTTYINVPHMMSIMLDDQFLYKVTDETYKGLNNFPEEETDKSGIMQYYCSKLFSPSGIPITIVENSLKNGYFVGLAEAKNYSITEESKDITKVTLGTYIRQSRTSEQYKLLSLHEIHIQVSELRGDDVYGMVVEKKVTRSCSDSNFEELKSVFSKF